MYKEITAIEFKEKFLNDFDRLELIDVREKSEFDQIKIKWSKLISMWDLGNKLGEIDWKKEVIFVCRTGSRSGYITNILNEKWYNSINLAWWINILRFNCEECISKWDFNSHYFD